MLGRIMDTLSVAIGAGREAADRLFHNHSERPGPGLIGRGEVLIHNQPHRVVALDRHRFIADDYRGDLAPWRTFACVLALDGFRPGEPVVCMATVERVENGRLLAVYLPDNTRDRADLDAWWALRTP